MRPYVSDLACPTDAPLDHAGYIITTH